MRSQDAPIIVVGAGPVGLALALELRRHGAEVILLERRTGPTEEGSKAINLAAHALRFLQRLGVASELLAEGTVLTCARTYYGERELVAKTIEPPRAGLLPAFINVAQSRTEDALLTGVEADSRIELVWGADVTSLEQDEHAVAVTVAQGGVESTLRGSYLVGCDGSRSFVRKALGVGFPGQSYGDRFLIADIRAELPFPNERRFFFDPPFNRGRQVLIHPQPHSAWRIDWQVADTADHEREGAITERVRAIIGDTPFELDWLSTYRFHQRLAEGFRSGRVFLAGDAAHLMSPFGGRGLNSGFEDAANLGWKLGQVLAGSATLDLLDTYSPERRHAARANLAVTGATMRFLVPDNPMRRIRRKLLLASSVRVPALRRYVDSGRLAEPVPYPPAVHAKGQPPAPGEYAPDVEVGLTDSGERVGIQALRADRHVALVIAPPDAEPPVGEVLRCPSGGVEMLMSGKQPADSSTTGIRPVYDPTGRLRQLYGAGDRIAGYLLRPDGYVERRVIASDWAALGGLRPTHLVGDQPVAEGGAR